MEDQTTLPAVAVHGADKLPSVYVNTYNEEIKDNKGFVGDRANKGAFRQMIDRIRKSVRKAGGEDPLGDEESDELTKAELDDLLMHGDPEAAGVVQGAIEEFSQEFAHVIRRFLNHKDWKDTEKVAIGGGFRGSRIGELAIGRTSVLLKGEGVEASLQPIHNDPDEAGLIGAVHLAPGWVFTAFDAVLGVDIGGTNIRAGIIRLNQKKAKDLSRAKVWKFSLWRHGDEEGVKRDIAITRLAEMLEGLILAAKKKRIKLAPFIGIGCPGFIEKDGSIDRGAQNLPGNWESSKFNLPATLQKMIPVVGDHETSIVMHNDAVVQGLSEIPYMRDVERWGVLTIGTGLGNARFTNRNSGEE
jgi:hypothetical protein